MLAPGIRAATNYVVEVVAGLAMSVVVLVLGRPVERSPSRCVPEMLQTFLPRQVNVSQPGAASVLRKTSPAAQVNGSLVPLCTSGFVRERCPVTFAGLSGSPASASAGACTGGAAGLTDASS